jgi:hypothetical protein
VFAVRPAQVVQPGEGDPVLAFGDFDNDGGMDILIMNVNEPPSLLRNDVSGGGHWLKVNLICIAYSGSHAMLRFKNFTPSNAIDSGDGAMSRQMDAAADNSPNAKPKLSIVSQPS